MMRQRLFEFMVPRISLHQAAYWCSLILLRQAKDYAWQQQDRDSWLWRMFQASGEFVVTDSNPANQEWTNLLRRWKRLLSSAR